MPDTSNLSDAKRALLEKLLRGDLEESSKDTDTISRRGQEGPVPLSFNQQQFWLLSQMNPNTPTHNGGLYILLPGPLHVAALEQSLSELIKRHEAWRTSFPVVDGEPAQYIHPPAAFPLPVVDVRHLSEADREAEATRLGTELINLPFDLARTPPVRALLVRLRDEEHRLFLALHHIISDGFSANQVALPELHALYQAFSTGQPVALPELPIQYPDYALWQRETMQGAVLEDHLAYWRTQLADAPTELALPTDHPRSAATSEQASLIPFSLPAGLSNALKALSQQEGTTLFITLLAAFSILLQRYSGQDDIVIGSPASCRTRPEVQGLLGVFVNSLALRLDLAGNPSFRDLLKRAHEVTSSALEHEDLPFEQIVRYLQPERIAGQNPFFQVMLILQPPTSPLSLGWSMSQMAPQNDLAKFDLALDLEEHPAGLSGFLGYKTELFEPATIKRVIGHLQTLLAGIVANPDQSIADLPLLTQAEQHQMLVEWNATRVDYPEEHCVHRLFEAQAQRTPDATAVVYAGTPLTYRDLNQRANQLAAYLRELGVGPDVPVGLCLERSLELAVGVLGILKAGGPYVPLDPNYPAQRLSYMLSNAQAPVVLTQQSLLDQLPETSANVICLDSEWARIQQYSPENLPDGATPDNLAYVIYTSGSTGKPKGVAMGHRALANMLLWQLASEELPKRVRTLQFAALSFDVAFQEIFTTWCSGGTLFLIAEEERKDFPRLLHFLKEQAIEGIFMPFVALRHLAETAETIEELPSSLRTIITAGEQLQITPAITALFKRLNNCTLYNQYGPSESHVVTVFALEGAPETWPGLPPIGKPIANAEVYVLDRALKPVPVGVLGELYIGGTTLASGYLHRPELTAERFIRHPFSTRPDARLYKTGDLARYRPDGNIDFIGRTDHQVKVRGFRIELGEIETVLGQHPAVKAVAVVARKDPPADTRLVAYIVPSAGQAPGSSELRAFLKERLPDYMIPAVFMTLEALPLTPSGKLNRLALPAPEAGNTQRDHAIVAPRTPTEEQLAAIWAELLGLPQVGVTENFFELGGHSLLAVRALARVQQSFQVQLPLSSLFEAPTIADLALKIVQSHAAQLDEAVLAQLLAELE